MSAKETWPNFLIIGEPRCGTSSLHDWLSQHPDIYMSPIKEPHYFSSINFPNIERQILRMTKSKAEYLALFEKGRNKLFRGESSTYYLSDPKAPKKISETLPDVKLIAILREPVERAYSHYLLYSRRGDQDKSFADMIQENIEGKSNAAYDFVELGKYHKHLKNYLKYFNKNQMLVLNFNNLKSDPQATLATVLEFLGTETGSLASIDVTATSNAYAQPRNKLSGALLSNKFLTNIGLKIVPRKVLRKIRKTLLKNGKKPKIDEETAIRLSELYKGEIARLENLQDENCKSLYYQPTQYNQEIELSEYGNIIR